MPQVNAKRWPWNRKLQESDRMHISALGKSLLKERNHLARLELLRNLDKENHSVSIPHIAKSLFDPNYEVILKAAKILGNMPHEKAEYELRRAIRDHSNRVIGMNGITEQKISAIREILPQYNKLAIVAIWECLKQKTKH